MQFALFVFPISAYARFGVQSQFVVSVFPYVLGYEHPARFQIALVRSQSYD